MTRRTGVEPSRRKRTETYVSNRRRQRLLPFPLSPPLIASSSSSRDISLNHDVTVNHDIVDASP